MEIVERKTVKGRIRLTGEICDFKPIEREELKDKYSWMEVVSGVFYKESDIDILDNKEEIYGQVCQDWDITKKFRELHTELVNRVIEFCSDNKISIDEFYLHADCLKESIPYGSWQPCTDSGFNMYDFEGGPRDLEKTPFLFSM